MGAIRQYLQAQAGQDELVEWFVGMPGLTAQDNQLGVEPALSVRGRPFSRISRTRLRDKPYDIGTLVNPATRSGPPGSGDEEIGLSDDQRAAARVAADPNQRGSFPRELRRQRSPREGLLLIYPISPNSQPRRGRLNRLPLFDEPERDGLTVVGVALVFPASDSAATIEYVVGSVGTPLGDDE